MQEFCNNRAKSFKNIWKIKKLVLSLHRFSLIKTSEGHAKVLAIFFEKSFQKIWMFQKYVLLLHRFSALENGGVKNGSSDANQNIVL